ncbi:hypothetical protein FALCPG4_015326 [Fusarium falciforme]
MGTTNKSYMTVHPFLSQQTSTIDSDNARTVSLLAHGLKPIFGDSFSVITKSPSRSSDPESQQQQQCRLGGRKGRKGRKKLDYRRTSVACNPCRRRKIRCIISSSDSRGRCIACIRLKKECSFYPTDQPPHTSHAKKSSQPSSGPKGSPTPSSPATSSGKPAEPPSQPFTPLATLQAPSMVPTGKPTANTEGFTSRERGTVQRPGSEMAELKTIWGSHPSGSPISAQIPPFAPIPPNWTSGSSGPGSHDDVAWGNYASLLRSLSFGSVSPNSISWEVELQAMPTWTHSVAQPGPRDEVPGWGPPYRNTIVVSSTDGGAEGGVVEPRESVYT